MKALLLILIGSALAYIGYSTFDAAIPAVSKPKWECVEKHVEENSLNVICDSYYREANKSH